MSEHLSAVFNNSCLKIPVNPVNKLPAPIYEQKFINHIHNEAVKLDTELKKKEEDLKMKKSPEKDTFKSLLEFYDSIPDYNDINHLSNQEFYKKIEHLKAKQRLYYDILDAEYNLDNKIEKFVDNYKQQASGERHLSSKNLNSKSNIKPLSKYADQRKESPESDSTTSTKEIPAAPPSRRSVRIESPKSELEFKGSDRNSKRSTRNVSSAGSKGSHKTISSDKDWDDCNISNDDTLELNIPLATRSLPGSPVKNRPNWKEGGITIPKPFQMTIRDEEEQIVNEILHKSSKPKEEKPEMFKAHPVPIESKIPLFDKIMEDQEIRRQIVKEKSKLNLMSKMKPFSFTKREEEFNLLTNRFSKSSPQLCPQLYSSYNCPELFIKPFKAKPVPKNLFSNYIYKKMHEDEFYRALRKKIRAEELLKASSLPPSMAAREKTSNCKKDSICPRSYRSFDYGPIETKKHKKKSTVYPKYDELDLELEDLQNDFITTTPRPFKFQTAKRIEKKRARSAKRCYRANEYHNSDECKRAQSALELQSVNRSNLAAVLRIQSARLFDLSSLPTSRKRMEMEMCKRLEEQKIKEEARWRERVMRQRPVWQELNYSQEEELAMRLQLRKEEEKLREQEHRHHMELMYGRVQQMPTLFERQSQVKAPKTKKEFIQTLYNETNYSPNRKKNISPDSSDWDKLEEYIYKNTGVQTSNKINEDDEEKDQCENSND